MPKDISVPTTPNKLIMMKFWKNCFFLTWNLVYKKNQWEKVQGNSEKSNPHDCDLKKKKLKLRTECTKFTSFKIDWMDYKESRVNWQKNEIRDKVQAYPALNMIGGRRHIKNRSSSNNKMSEILPLVVSIITVAVHRPCNQTQERINYLFLKRRTNQNK